jgi:hypothetical protein
MLSIVASVGRSLRWRLVPLEVCQLSGGCSLDTSVLHTYSLPFRTEGLKSSKQRPVGSVGVEALLGR